MFWSSIALSIRLKTEHATRKSSARPQSRKRINDLGPELVVASGAGIHRFFLTAELYLIPAAFTIRLASAASEANGALSEAFELLWAESKGFLTSRAAFARLAKRRMFVKARK